MYRDILEIKRNCKNSIFPNPIILFFYNLIIIFLIGTLINCAHSPDRLKSMEIKQLIELWQSGSNIVLHKAIVNEFENRKAIDALNVCLDYISTFPTNIRKWENRGLDDSLIIISAMARLKDSRAIPTLNYATRRIDNNKLKHAVLDAYKKIGDPSAAMPVTELLNDPDDEIKWKALDTLAVLKNPESREAIYPLLSNLNSNVRIIAVYALGEIGDPDDITRLRLLLMDNDHSVRSSVEKVLAEKYSVTETQINNWKSNKGISFFNNVFSPKNKKANKNLSKQDGLSKTNETDFYLKNYDLGKYHAIVIGNNDYKYLPELLTAENDAKEISKILEEIYEFEVKLILNGTRHEILLAMDKFRLRLTEKDNLLIYYAGHGYFDKEVDRGYWLPVNATKETSAYWISNADITDKLRALKAKHIIVIADSCYSGTLTRGVFIQEAPSIYLTKIVKKKARTVLTSGGVEPVTDGIDGGHSVFAKSLINALLTNEDIIDGTRLFSKIRRQVMVNSPQTPQYSDIRFAGHEGGDFLFVRKR